MLFIRCFIMVLFLCLPGFCAEAVRPAPDGGAARYAEARLIYGAANACLASYEDKVGNLFYRFIEEDGWRVERRHVDDERLDTDVFLAYKYDGQKGEDVYLMSFRGVKNAKDRAAGVRIARVPFAGANAGEFRENALAGEAPKGSPAVHAGFLEYALAGFAVQIQDKAGGQPRPLYEVIKNDPKARLIITGHSMGGSAATIFAAALLDAGVPKERVTVLTFGAPAPGNLAFSQKYNPLMDLLRVYSSFDPIPGSLQSVHGGYVQFGRPLVINADVRYKGIQHSMENYADMAGKYFYDVKKREIAEKNIPDDINTVNDGSGGAVAVMTACSRETARMMDFYYMHQNMLDVYRNKLLNYRITDEYRTDITKSEAIELARAAGAEHLILSEVDIVRERNSLAWIVSLSQNVFKTGDGSLVSGSVFSGRIPAGGSFFQAGAYNVFRAIAELDAAGVKWVRPPAAPAE